MCFTCALLLLYSIYFTSHSADDTCINARAVGIERVHFVVDAARAAHVPGVGLFGSGFLSDPLKVCVRCYYMCVLILLYMRTHT